MTHKGFTLVELLLAVVLFPVIAFAVYLNFNSGVRIWQTLNSGVAEEDTQLFFKKMTRDLQNSFRYSGSPFLGEEREFSFATFVDTGSALGGSKAPGQATYLYDAGKKVILRQERNAHELYKEKAGNIREVLRDIYMFKVSYFAYDKTSKAFNWVGSWPLEEKTLPLALKLELESHALGETRTLTRTFEIPTGG